jgi:hypothetical protein
MARCYNSDCMMRRLTIGKGLKFNLPLLLFFAAFPARAFSQDYEGMNARMLRETREAFVREQRELSLLSLVANRFDHAMADRDFITRVPKFRQAVENYRMAMGFEGSTQKPLKEIDKLVNAFKNYFRQTSVDSEAADPAEFQDFTPKELLWETLTSAERIDTKLRQAALLIQQSSASNVINIKAMLFLRSLHSELLRLHLLISKLK